MREIFDEVAAALPADATESERFLVGSSFSAADMTFAALASPVLLVQEHEGCYSPYPGEVVLSDDLRRIREEFRGACGRQQQQQKIGPLLSTTMYLSRSPAFSSCVLLNAAHPAGQHALRMFAHHRGSSARQGFVGTQPWDDPVLLVGAASVFAVVAMYLFWVFL